jgi:Putative zinc-finger
MSDPNTHDQRGHESVWLLLPWYANGTLDAAEREAVEEHLAGCASCREELASCDSLAAVLRSSPEGAGAPSPHPIQLERLLARLTRLDQLDQRAPLAPTAPDEASGLGIEAETDARADTEAGADLADSRDGAGGRKAWMAGAHTERSERSESARGGRSARRGRLEPPRRRASVLALTPPPVRVALAAQLAAMVLLAAALFLAPARSISGRSAPASPAAAPPAVYHVLSEPSGGAETFSAAPRPQIRLLFVEAATEKQIRAVLLKARGRLVDGPSPLGTYTIEFPAPPPPAATPSMPVPAPAGAGRAAGPSVGPGAARQHPLPADGAPDSLGIVLAYLRSQPIVRFAEPVAGTAPGAAAAAEPVSAGRPSAEPPR